MHTTIKVRLIYRNNFVEIIIDDDGPGIPKKERNKVLQPFYRVEGSRNRDTGGIGLGIIVVGAIVIGGIVLFLVAVTGVFS